MEYYNYDTIAQNVFATRSKIVILRAARTPADFETMNLLSHVTFATIRGDIKYTARSLFNFSSFFLFIAAFFSEIDFLIVSLLVNVTR